MSKYFEYCTLRTHACPLAEKGRVSLARSQHTHTHTHTHTQTHTNTHKNTQTHTQFVHMRARWQILRALCVWPGLSTHTHIHTQTNTHRYTNTHTLHTNASPLADERIVRLGRCQHTHRLRKTPENKRQRVCVCVCVCVCACVCLCVRVPPTPPSTFIK